MNRKKKWLAALAAAAVTAVGVGVQVGIASAESNGGVRIMPLGDSITEGTQVPGGYRIGLWNRLAAGGYRNDFVGSQFNGPGQLGDHDHEGHPGWRIDQIDANIVGWLRNTTPRSVLLHIGTNDILQNYNVSSAPTRLSNLVDKITNTVPTADVFVASIIPISNSGQNTAARNFNSTIPGMVQSKVNAGRKVHFVDMYSALTTGDLIDGVHPTATGYDKMAARWFSALQAVPGSISTSTPSPTRPTPSSPAPSPTLSTSPSPIPDTSPPPPPSSSPAQPTGGCSATWALAGQWPGGFQADITVTAGSRPVNGWTVTWQLPGGATVAQAWSATVTTANGTVTAQNVSYNGTIAAGGNTRFGLLGSSTTTPGTPALQCTAS